MIPIIFAELHAPMFLNGISLGNKLDPSKKSGLEMWYREHDKMLIIGYNKVRTLMPYTSAVHFIPKNQEDIGFNDPQVLVASNPVVHHPQTHVGSSIGLSTHARKAPQQGAESLDNVPVVDELVCHIVEP